MFYHIYIDSYYAKKKSDYYSFPKETYMVIYRIKTNREYLFFNTMNNLNPIFDKTISISKDLIDTVIVGRWIENFKNVLLLMYPLEKSGFFIPEKDFNLFFDFLDSEILIYSSIGQDEIVKLIKEIKRCCKG